MDIFTEKSRLAMEELAQVFERMSDAEVRPLLDEIKRTPRIFTVGAGREGLSTRSFAMRLAHLGKASHWIWDDTTPAIGQGNLLIAPCGPGSIGHIDHIIARARENGARVAVLSPSQGGTAIEAADILVRVPAAAYHAEGDFVPSRQLMGNLFEQSLFILYDVLIMVLAEEMGVTPAEMEKRHRNVE
ncbi:silent information regulator protein Sir2 [Clostridia bacterium]|nr:silent information regulator protein Sir2 [Clostridia bacterium]